MTEPQFSGQTKERLSSQGASGIVASAVRDALALWLNQHVEAGLAAASRMRLLLC
jgi:topoisomerase-4 subunit B